MWINRITTRYRWQFTICTITNVLTLYSFSSLYIFVTWGWPTVTETCRRQPNKTDTKTVVFWRTHALLVGIVIVTVPDAQYDRLLVITSSMLTVHLKSHQLTSFVQTVRVPIQFTVHERFHPLITASFLEHGLFITINYKICARTKTERNSPWMRFCTNVGRY